MPKTNSYPWPDPRVSRAALAAAAEIEVFRTRFGPAVLGDLVQPGPVRVWKFLAIRTAAQRSQEIVKRFDPRHFPILFGAADLAAALDRTCQTVRDRCRRRLREVEEAGDKTSDRVLLSLLDEVSDLVRLTDVLPPGFRARFHKRRERLVVSVRSSREEMAPLALGMPESLAAHAGDDAPTLEEVLALAEKVEPYLSHPDQKGRAGLISRVSRRVARHLAAVFSGMSASSLPADVHHRLSRLARLAGAMPSPWWNRLLEAEPAFAELTCTVFETAVSLDGPHPVGWVEARLDYLSSLAEILVHASPLVSRLRVHERHPCVVVARAVASLVAEGGRARYLVKGGGRILGLLLAAGGDPVASALQEPARVVGSPPLLPNRMDVTLLLSSVGRSLLRVRDRIVGLLNRDARPLVAVLGIGAAIGLALAGLQGRDAVAAPSRVAQRDKLRSALEGMEIEALARPTEALLDRLVHDPDSEELLATFTGMWRSFRQADAVIVKADLGATIVNRVEAAGSPADAELGCIVTAVENQLRDSTGEWVSGVLQDQAARAEATSPGLALAETIATLTEGLQRLERPSNPRAVRNAAVPVRRALYSLNQGRDLTDRVSRWASKRTESTEPWASWDEFRAALRSSPDGSPHNGVILDVVDERVGSAILEGIDDLQRNAAVEGDLTGDNDIILERLSRYLEVRTRRRKP